MMTVYSQLNTILSSFPLNDDGRNVCMWHMFSNISNKFYRIKWGEKKSIFIEYMYYMNLISIEAYRQHLDSSKKGVMWTRIN